MVTEIKTTAGIILLKLIFISLEPNLINAQEIGLEDNSLSVQEMSTHLDSVAIDQHPQFLLSQGTLPINLNDLQYEEKPIKLKDDFRLSSPASPAIETFSSHTLINGNYFVLSNDSLISSTELDFVSQNHQQIDQQNSLHNLNGDQTNNLSSANLWNLTDKYLAISPVSWHIDYTEPDVNNFPMGVGAAYDFEIINPNYGFFNNLIEDSIASLEFNIFRDSDFGYPAAYVGLSLRKNIFASPIQVGSAIGLLYTTQLQELSGSPVLPFMLPFLQTDFDIPVNLRLVYIPSFADYNSQQIFFTLMIKVN